MTVNQARVSNKGDGRRGPILDLSADVGYREEGGMMTPYF